MNLITGDNLWVEQENRQSLIDPNKLCKTGIKCIDNTIIGLLRNDLLVIGGDSGSGKSECGIKSALFNARNNRKVGLYFLEGGAYEAMARIRWNLICEKYYAEGATGIDMNYRNWRMNLINNPKLKEISDKCKEEYKFILNNIKFYINPEGMNWESFNKSLESYVESTPGFEFDPTKNKHNVDLLIIDHLQYFNLTNPSKELIEQSEILKKVNSITTEFNIPIILLSHLRKKDKDRGIPSQEDFYGTSNIPKMSSISITIGSTDSTDGVRFPTFFRFVKSRTKIPGNFALLCNYNLKLGGYEDNYYVHKLKGDKPGTEALKEFEIPPQFKNATPRTERDKGIKIESYDEKEGTLWSE